MKIVSNIIISLAMGVIVIGLLSVSLVNFYYRSDIVTGSVIADDVKELAIILQKIDKECTIMGFDHQQNSLNFLNVISFSGSEVGSMNLAHPEYWKGPYQEDNAAVQGVEYMLVKTNDGYFVTPGNGVKLPNGKIIGQDIIFDKESNIGAMMYDKNALYYNGKPLAASVSLGRHYVPVVETGEE
jgi:hypothetical protein